MDLETDAKGRKKRKMIYIGPLFQWATPESCRRKLLQQCSVTAALGWILYFLGIWNYSRLSHIWYVILPYICIFLCLCFLSNCLWRIGRTPQPFEREQKDKMTDRFRSSSAMGMLLAAAAGAGQIFNLVRAGFLPGMADAFLIAVTWIQFFLFLLCFRQGKQLQISVLTNPMTKEWENR